MAIDKELLDQLLAGRDPKDLFSKDGLLDDLKQALSERILDAELDEHLEKEALESGGNRRNGTSKKTVLTGTSKLTISVPRDRAGSFDPKLIAKYQRRWPRRASRPISLRPEAARSRSPMTSCSIASATRSRTCSASSRIGDASPPAMIAAPIPSSRQSALPQPSHSGCNQ
jgi:putative transposase